MKKLLVIGLAVLMVLGFSGMVMADVPTTFNTTWSGAGTVTATVNTGDALAGFFTNGWAVNGTYSATDFNDNPYSYGVDAFEAYLIASVGDGYINTGCDRTNSYSGMYGSAGQTSWSDVFVDGGIASMAYRTTTNFAQMVDGSYTYQLSGGHNIVANATYFDIDRGISDGRGNSGVINAWGSGTATLDCMESGASGVWPLHFGHGSCYTDANYNATGSGHFDVFGTGNNGVTFDGLSLSFGGGTGGFVVDYTNGFSFADYSLTAW